MSPNVVDVSVDTREEGPDLNIRLSVASKVMGPGAEVGAWCVFCDTKDKYVGAVDADEVDVRELE